LDLIRQLDVSDSYVEAAIEHGRAELARRAGLYRGESPAPSASARVVVVADDGVATGATLRATLQAVRRQSPAYLVCAVPVGPHDSVDAVAEEVDAMVCPLLPRWFRAVGEWYDRFDQTVDEEVIALLRGARRRSSWRPDHEDR
jgi:predicted phosphoribosyltransferase